MYKYLSVEKDCIYIFANIWRYFQRKEKAGIMVCVELVKEELLSIADAAKRLNMKEEEPKTYL